MKRLFSLASAAALAVAVVTPVFAAASPWDGSWEIPPDKSKVTVHTFSYAMTPDGKIQYWNGPTFGYAFACDGKSYPTVANRTIVCTKGGPSEYDFAYAENGKAVESDVLTLSADGTSLSVEKTIQLPRPAIVNEPFLRRPGTSGLGLAGTWTDYWRSDGFVLTTDPSGITTMTIPITNPDPPSKKTLALKLDGSPWLVPGPSHPPLPPGLVCRVKSAGAHEFVGSCRVGIKPFSNSIMALNPGGKTMTVSTWTAGKKGEKVILYEKQ